MIYYQYEYQVDGKRYLFIIEKPTAVFALYRVTINGNFVGCLFNDYTNEQAKWRATTNALKPIVKKLGHVIDDMEPAITD